MLLDVQWTQRVEGRALPKVGEVVDGKYRIVGALGSGGMGVVLAAHQVHFDQRVALKVLLARDDTSRSRFSVEARATARLRSEHVARLMDVGTLPSGPPYLVFEYLEGVDLAELLRRKGPLAVADAVDYVLQALEGISEAHAHGIIHRDLKPSNLFLCAQPSGAPLVKVLDFGISKATGEGRDGRMGSLTGEHVTVGSPRYMSPEQVRKAKRVDARSDVWSLGVVLYELLSGSPPFPSEGVGETFAAILERDAPDLTSAQPRVPRPLAAAVARCLRRDPAARFANVFDLAKAIGPFGPADSPLRVARIEQTLKHAKAGAAPGRFCLPTPSAPLGLADAVATESGSYAIRVSAPSLPDASETGRVAFTSEAPKPEPLATTVMSFVRRARLRTVVVGALTAAFLGGTTAVIARGQRQSLAARAVATPSVIALKVEDEHVPHAAPRVSPAPPPPPTMPPRLEGQRAPSAAPAPRSGEELRGPTVPRSDDSAPSVAPTPPTVPVAASATPSTKPTAPRTSGAPAGHLAVRPASVVKAPLLEAHPGTPGLPVAAKRPSALESTD